MITFLFVAMSSTTLIALDFWQNHTLGHLQRPELTRQAHKLINEANQVLEKIVSHKERGLILEQDLTFLHDTVNTALKKIADNYALDSATYYNKDDDNPLRNYINGLSLIKDQDALFAYYADDQVLLLNSTFTTIIWKLKNGNPRTQSEDRAHIQDLLNNADYTQRMVCIFILLAANYFEPSFVEWAVGALLRYADETADDIYLWRPLCNASLHHLYKLVYRLNTNTDCTSQKTILLAILRAYKNYTGDPSDYTTETVEYGLKQYYYNDSPKNLLKTASIVVQGLPAPLNFFPGYKKPTPSYDSNEGPIMSEELRIVLQLNTLRNKIKHIQESCAREAVKKQPQEATLLTPWLTAIHKPKIRNFALITDIDFYPESETISNLSLSPTHEDSNSNPPSRTSPASLENIFGQLRISPQPTTSTEALPVSTNSPFTPPAKKQRDRFSNISSSLCRVFFNTKTIPS